LIVLKTITKSKSFKYDGSVNKGTTIYFGEGNKVYVSNDKWTSLIKTFNSKTIRIGSSRTDPQKGSLGDWLMNNVTKQAIASYIAPILIHEEFAKQEGRFNIKFNKF
jgi:hypothetical protein